MVLLVATLVLIVFLVLVAIVVGILAGVFFPSGAVALKPLGDGFVRLIRMTLAPIIFASVVIGIARMGDLKEVGRVGAKALLYFEVVSTISLFMGLIGTQIAPSFQAAIAAIGK